MIEVNIINYKEKYIKFKEDINFKINKKEKEIKEMRCYFDETDNIDIRYREDRIKILENIKKEGETIIKNLRQEVSESDAYETAYIYMIEEYIKLCRI